VQFGSILDFIFMVLRIRYIVGVVILFIIHSCNNSTVKNKTEDISYGTRGNVTPKKIVDSSLLSYKEISKEVKKIKKVASPSKSRKNTASNIYKQAMYLLKFGQFQKAIFLLDSTIEANPTFEYAYFHRGFAKEKLMDFDGALVDYSTAINLDKKLAEAYHRRGLLKEKLKDHLAAHNDFDTAYSLNNSRTDYLLSRGRSKMLGNDFEGAKKDLMSAKMAENSGNDIDSVSQRYIVALSSYDDALLEIEKKKSKKALEMLNQAINLAPDNGYFYYKRAEVLNGMHRFEEALNDYSKSIEMANDPNAYNSRGLIRFQLVDIAGAIKDFDDAIEKNGMYSEAYLNRGIAKAEQDSTQSAIDDFSTAIKTHKYEDTTQSKVLEAIAYYERGRGYSKLGKYKLAIEDYNHSLILDSSNSNVFYDKAVAETSIGDYENSLNDYSTAIQKDRNAAGAYNNRGLVKLFLVDYEGSVKDFSQAIAIDSSMTEALANRANAKIEMGDYVGAISDFDKAIAKGFTKKTSKRHIKAPAQADPQSHSHALLKRAHAKYKLLDYKGAIADYDQAIATNQGNFEAFYCRANLKSDLKDEKGALADYDKAVELAPENAKVYYNRGTHFFEFAQYEKAVADYSKALELDPQMMQAFHNRGAIFEELQEFQKAIDDYSEAIELEKANNDPMLVESLKFRGISKLSINDETACDDIEQAIKLGATGMKEYSKKCR
jgi:tetratricopeptide (TPR) repeat protein